MPALLSKSSILDLAPLIVLAILAALLWIDLHSIQGEVNVMQAERDLLSLRVRELQEEREDLEEQLENKLIEAGILSNDIGFNVRGSGVVTVTAYSSTPDQTDATPFITASGTRVRDGVAAANFLPFHTKIRLPEAFGGKVFIVEDRMKRDDLVDIWFSTREEALAFGVRNLKIEILNN
mgnify:FL=1